MADWIEPMLRRESTAPPVMESPGVPSARPAGRGALAGAYLLQHPGVIDELATTPCCRSASRRRFERDSSTPQVAAAHGEDDDEALMKLLRGATTRGVPHPGARRRGRLTVEDVEGPIGAGRLGAAGDRAVVLHASSSGTARAAVRGHGYANSAARNWATERPGHRPRLRGRTKLRPRPCRLRAKMITG